MMGDLALTLACESQQLLELLGTCSCWNQKNIASICVISLSSKTMHGTTKKHHQQHSVSEATTPSHPL